MDVINLSAGFSAPPTGPLDTGAACGLAAGAPCDLLATAFENDVKAGAVVVVSAGNDNYFICDTYPCFNTISSPATAPSVISVGASTNSHYFLPTVTVAGAPSNLQNIGAQPGDDPGQPVGAFTYPVVDVTTLGDNGLACNALPDATLSGKFALIQRGTCTFATKATNAWNAGAFGVIMYMADGTASVRPLGLDNNGIPVVMISQADGQNLKSYIASNPAAQVTIDPAGTETDDTVNQNFLLYFSSVGPNIGDYAVKPEIVAVGGGYQPTDAFRPEGGIYMAAQNYDPDGGQYSTKRYAAAEGTSFSAPMVAGAAALVKQKHPTWTPAQIKSALVNTASQDVLTDDSGNLIDVEWIGAGKLDAGAAVNTSVAVSPSTVSFGLLTSGATPAPQQLALTNLGSASVTLSISVAAGSASSTGNLKTGPVPTVDKTSVTLAAGASTTVTVSLPGNVPGAGAYNGAIKITGGASPLTVPYAYYVGGASNTGYTLLFVGGGGFFEAIIGNQPYDALLRTRPAAIGVRLIDENGVPVPGQAVTWSVSPRNAVTFKNSSTTTDAFGVAMTDLVVNQTSSTVTVSVAGKSAQFTGMGWRQPTISTGGVVNAANNTAPIAPGSYVAIYGTDLSYYTEQNYHPILPLSLDGAYGAGVTVSFDTTNGSYPGRMVFISPGQVNVQVPWELQGQTSAQVKVTINNYIFGNVVSVPVTDATPSFFETSSGVAAAVDNGSGKVVLTSAPIKRGGIVQLYMNGLGPTNNQPASGEPASSDATKLATTKATPTVQIGGQSAQVFYSGLAPGFPGLYQVTVSVPSGISTGTVPASVTINGKTATSGLPVN
jgi:uncharacterized protein (TIGR03437 family)